MIILNRLLGLYDTHTAAFSEHLNLLRFSRSVILNPILILCYMLFTF